MSYYDTRLGIVNNWASPSTPGWNATDDFALNSVFSNLFASLGANASSAGDFAQLSNNSISSNPFGNLASIWSLPQMSLPQSSGGNWLSNVFGSLGSWGVQGGSNSGPANIPSYASQNNINKIKELDPLMQQAVVELMEYAHAEGIPFEISEGYCPAEVRKARRDKAIEEGKGREAFYAKDGNSKHIFRKAIDLNRKVTSPEDLKRLGQKWTAMQCEWGGRWKDTDHSRTEIWHFALEAQGQATRYKPNGNYSSGVASGGYPNTWGSGFDFSFPSFSSSMGGFGSGFGSDFGGNWGSSWINSMFGGSFGSSGLGYGNLGGGTTFERGLNFVLKREGGLANNANDKGGLTNKGITHSTYNNWRIRHGLPTQSVSNITQEEANKIYYESYWIPSGAGNISDSRLAIAVFDSAVNMGVGTAKQLYQQSGGDLNRFVQLRKERYIAIVEKDPSQRVFLNRWLQRSEVSASI